MNTLESTNVTIEVNSISVTMTSEKLVNLASNSSVGQTVSPGVEAGITLIITELNQEETIRQIPLLTFLALVSLLGMIGNIIVWYIYGFLYTASNSRTFITCLAVVDFCTCAFAVPVEMVTVWNLYQFDAPWTCKVSRFTNAATSTSSASILLLIATDRFRKICRPFSWQFSNKQANFLCLGAISVGLFLAWPSLVLKGVKSTEISLEENLNGTITECSTDDEYSNSRLPLVYNLVFLLSFLTTIIAMIVLYTLMGRKVKLFAQKRDRRRSSSFGVLDMGSSETRMARCSRNLTDVSSADTIDDTLGGKRNGTFTRLAVIANDKENTTEVTEIVTTNFAQDKSTSNTNISVIAKMSSTNTLTLRAGNKNQKKQTTSLARNTTYLMFIISIAFVLSFLPHLVVVLMRGSRRNFVGQLSNGGRTAYRFFLRSYFLNAAVNPALYSIFDRRFRTVLRNCMYNVRALICRSGCPS